MEDEQAADGQEQPQATETGAEAKPTETLEFWKAQARRNEKAMKANRKELDALRAQLQGSKSVEERLAALEGENAALKAAKARTDAVRAVSRATGVGESIVAALNGADEAPASDPAGGKPRRARARKRVAE